jgi:GT2 family glycosyltransferase
MTTAGPVQSASRVTPSARESVSVVIVNFNGAAVLKPCLESVFAQPYRPIEVIVIDNASSDGSREMIRKEFPEVRLALNDANLGFAEATNQGVAMASSDKVVLLNNDTRVASNWLKGLLDVACQSGVGVVTSKVVTDGVPEAHYEMNGTLNYLGYNIMRAFRDLSLVFYAGGASLVFSKSVVGLPFLHDYFLYHEDVFLSWRMRLRGFEIRMAQDSLVQHVGSATTRRQPSAFVTFYQERNRLLNALLLYEAGTLLRLLPLFLADGAAKCGMALFGVRKSFTGLAHAYGWIITHLRWIRRKRKELQRERRVPDRDILRLMSSKLLEGDDRLSSIVNTLSSMYARLVGLASHV